MPKSRRSNAPQTRHASWSRRLRNPAITSKSGLLIAKRDNALDALKIKAAELRKANPELTESQAFAKVYTDPANRALANAERQSARALCTPDRNSMLPSCPPGRASSLGGAGTYPAGAAIVSF